jgi:hypothetical protein
LFGVFPIGAALDHEGQPRSRVPLCKFALWLPY